MSIWFFLWLSLSAAMLYFMGWTVFILQRQKKAWREYAKRKKLRYTPNKTFANPEIKGTVDDYTIGIFTGEHVSADMRGTRKLTAIEVHLTSVMPFAAAAASGGMVAIVQNMGFKEELRPQHADWSKSYVAASENRHAFKAYLSDERVQALTALMKIKNAWTIFICRDEVTLLRLDTADPLDSPEKMDKIVTKLIQAAKVLELKPGESSRLKTEQARKPEREVALEVDEEKIRASGFQLEEDEPPKDQE